MFKYKTGKLPKSFDNMFEELALGNRTMSYRIKKNRHTSLNIIPKVYLPRIWNALPLDAKSSSTIKILQKSINNVAFENYEMHVKLVPLPGSNASLLRGVRTTANLVLLPKIECVGSKMTA